jgi:hypothetical protein
MPEAAVNNAEIGTLSLLACRQCDLNLERLLALHIGQAASGAINCRELAKWQDLGIEDLYVPKPSERPCTSNWLALYCNRKDLAISKHSG